MKKVVNLRSMLYVAIAVTAFVFAYKVGAMDEGRYASCHEYGGNAYTGIQNAAAITAQNVECLAELVRAGFRYLFILLGLGCLAKGLKVEASVEKVEE